MGTCSRQCLTGVGVIYYNQLLYREVTPQIEVLDSRISNVAVSNVFDDRQRLEAVIELLKFREMVHQYCIGHGNIGKRPARLRV